MFGLLGLWSLYITLHLLKVKKGTNRPVLDSSNLKAYINMLDIFGMGKKAQSLLYLVH